MSRIGIFYMACHMGTHVLFHTPPAFKGLKRCIQFISSNNKNPILYPYNDYYGSNFIRIRCIGYQVEY